MADAIELCLKAQRRFIRDHGGLVPEILYLGTETHTRLADTVGAQAAFYTAVPPGGIQRCAEFNGMRVFIVDMEEHMGFGFEAGP